MKIAIFGSTPDDRASFTLANASHRHSLTFFEPPLEPSTVAMASGFPAVCAFVNSVLCRRTLDALSQGGTRLVALRCPGDSNVDLDAARALGMTVARVPAYSPSSVAEHTLALILCLNRKIHRAFNRVREGNFALNGLLGFDLEGKTAGIVGTGQIGSRVARILRGFGCRVLALDPCPDPSCRDHGVEFVDWETLLEASDLITLHCPLTPRTHHLVDAEALAQMKDGVMLLNTSRAGVVDILAVLEAIKSGKIGHLGLDVYEEEDAVIDEDPSDRPIRDRVLTRLLTFPNVLVTGHQGYFTRETLAEIAETTLANVDAFEAGLLGGNEVVVPQVVRA
jgi:D-lactate dehydrogenase